MGSNQFTASTEHVFRLFDDNNTAGLSFLGFPEKPLPPPPPPIEVTAQEVLPDTKYHLDPVNAGGLTLLKGRVSTRDVFALSNSDLVPGKYEGGLKLWEGSLDLIEALSSELQQGRISFAGKRVLELGCGHGLPGIFACLKGSEAVHFQDFNAEVLRHLTLPNVTHNIERNQVEVSQGSLETRFFSGDWGDMESILPISSNGCHTGCTAQGQRGGYDIILMAETVYSICSLSKLYKLIKKCLSKADGVVYMAAKKHYFGVGGGSSQFLSVVDEDGTLSHSLITEIANGSSNVRGVWKLQHK